MKIYFFLSVWVFAYIDVHHVWAVPTDTEEGGRYLRDWFTYDDEHLSESTRVLVR